MHFVSAYPLIPFESLQRGAFTLWAKRVDGSRCRAAAAEREALREADISEEQSLLSGQTWRAGFAIVLVVASRKGGDKRAVAASAIGVAQCLDTAIDRQDEVPLLGSMNLSDLSAACVLIKEGQN